MENSSTLVKKCKGVKKSVVKKYLNFNHYKDCLFNKEQYDTNFNVFRSLKHNITMETVTKVALTANDDKRFLLRDGSHETLPWGHWKVPFLKELYKLDDHLDIETTSENT